MKGHDGGPAVRVPQKVVTPSSSGYFESKPPERRNELLARQAWQASHLAMVSL